MNKMEPFILKKVQDGDESVFGIIVESFQKPVFNICYRMLGNIEAAEDATLETFWKAFRSIKKFNPEKSFPVWLYSISMHHCIDEYRRRKFLLIEMEDSLAEILPDSNVPNPESLTIRKEHQKQLQELLNNLPDIDRALIILRYWHECSVEEMSQILDIAPNSVKIRLHRA